MPFKIDENIGDENIGKELEQKPILPEVKKSMLQSTLKQVGFANREIERDIDLKGKDVEEIKRLTCLYCKETCNKTPKNKLDCLISGQMKPRVKDYMDRADI